MTTQSLNPIAMGLEQGLNALISSKATHAIVALTSSPTDAVLVCLSLAVLHRAFSQRQPVLWRLADITDRVLFSIALNTVLHWVSSERDILLLATSLLAIHSWAQALDRDGQISTTAQYLLVARLSALMDGLHRTDVLAAAWVLAFAPTGYFSPDIAALAQLVTVESLNTWLQGWFPRSLLMPSTALVLYLCAPFIDEFPTLQRVYRFAVFALTSEAQLAGLPPWLLTVALWGAWRIDAEPVSRRLLAIAGTNLATLTVLDASRFAMDDDPVPTLIGAFLLIKILEESAVKTAAKHQRPLERDVPMAHVPR
jgi:hypothetical protein